MSTKSKNLDVHLAEVFKQFVALKDNDLKKAQEVFKSVFDQVKQRMGEQCNYFNKYASQVMYAGSVYDGIKVSKLDEFDMDIVIRLPISYEDGENGIVIENDQPGFVKMKIGRAFDNLDKQPEWETRHKVTRDWRDSEKYFLQNKFRHWMHSTVQKAINTMDGRVDVNGSVYALTYKASGPAYTLNVRSDGFSLDVDLVPVVRFMTPRWPEGYRCISGSQVREWLVVPKPNKCMQNEKLQNRCWRLSFQDFERELIKGCQQLKCTIRLVKKLRDSLGMKAIASYYIKTLFLWKVDKEDKKYWETKISFTFRAMVQELHDAIVNKNIPYFWNERNNLIEGLKPTIQKLYADKLKAVLASIDANDADKVVAYLLTPEELREFKESAFYKTQALLTNATVSRQTSVASSSTPLMGTVNDTQLASLVELVKTLTEKVDSLTDKVTLMDDRLKALEMAKKATAADDLKNLMFGVNSISLSGNETVSVDNSNNNSPFVIPAQKSETADLLTF
ncbi:cyclic GMP-AMP synthase-like receptor isoform X2 [Epargyreus clarus]